MNDFTFLTKEQCDKNTKLRIFQKHGRYAELTDFSILLGAKQKPFYMNRYVSYWTNYSSGESAFLASDDWDNRYASVYERSIGSRPAVPYSSIRNVSSNEYKYEDGIIRVYYGEYPQKAASQTLQDELERAYKNNDTSIIRKTGKIYTTDSKRYDDFESQFSAQNLEEFLCINGKKYVRVKANSKSDGSLSYGVRYKDGDYIWVEVEPVRWMINKSKDIALSEKILFAGVQFKNKINDNDDFLTTNIKQFMDNYFSKDIIPSFSNEILLELKQPEYERLRLMYELAQLSSIKNFYEKNPTIYKSFDITGVLRQFSTLIRVYGENYGLPEKNYRLYDFEEDYDLDKEQSESEKVLKKI